MFVAIRPVKLAETSPVVPDDVFNAPVQAFLCDLYIGRLALPHLVRRYHDFHVRGGMRIDELGTSIP